MIARVPPPTTVADLERFSEANPGWQVERESDGTIVMSPTNSDGGWRNLELAAIVAAWNRSAGRGKAFDSSTGFTMPDGAILSPDCAWLRLDRWRALSREQRTSYAPVVPDVCIEIVSPSQRSGDAVAKARRYRAYGAAYVVVLDPQTGDVWRDGTAPDAFPTDFSHVVGPDPDEA